MQKVNNEATRKAIHLRCYSWVLLPAVKSCLAAISRCEALEGPASDAVKIHTEIAVVN